MSSLVVTVFLALVAAIAALTRDGPCTTPNNEKAKCIPVRSCDVILQAITTLNQTALDFAKKSQCGHDVDTLVCCGTTAYPQELNPSSIPLPARSSFLPDRTVCGFQNLADRIVGGLATTIDEFPWMALLKYKNTLTDEVKFKCGGTLINNQYVLTAAHCVTGSPTRDSALFGVRLGEWDFSKIEDCFPDQLIRECADPVVDRLIEESIPHPFYSNKRGTNDIALLRLDSPVQYTEYIRPICLPPMDMPSPTAGTYMTVTGWELTDIAKTVKIKVSVPIKPIEECKKIFEMQSISSNQVCAGGDLCTGGSLIHHYTDLEDEERQWYQEGIGSFGTYECGVDGKPAVYTRTAPYFDWILNNLRD